MTGKQFESHIWQTLLEAQRFGAVCSWNHAKRTFAGDYLDGEQFDFEVKIPLNGKLHENHWFCFDAKHVENGGFNLKSRIFHNESGLRQLRHLWRANLSGAFGFFYIFFEEHQRSVALGVHSLLSAWESGIKSIKPDDTLDGKELCSPLDVSYFVELAHDHMPENFNRKIDWLEDRILKGEKIK